MADSAFLDAFRSGSDAVDDSKETEPLYPTAGKGASPQSATSDYHSDGLNATTQSDSMRKSRKARSKSGGSSSQGGTMNRYSAALSVSLHSRQFYGRRRG